MIEGEAQPAVRLPLSIWRILLAHLQAGSFQDVGNSLSVAIYNQIEPQLAAAAAAQQAKLVDEARNVVAEANAEAAQCKPVAPVGADAKAVH